MANLVLKPQVADFLDIVTAREARCPKAPFRSRGHARMRAVRAARSASFGSRMQPVRL